MTPSTAWPWNVRLIGVGAHTSATLLDSGGFSPSDVCRGVFHDDVIDRSTFFSFGLIVSSNLAFHNFMDRTRVLGSRERERRE